MRRLLVVWLALAVLCGALLATAEKAAAAAPQGGFVDQVIFFEQPSAATALGQVSQGNQMQIYMFNLRNLADKIAALSDPNVWTVQTPGSVNDLWVNPVPYLPNVNNTAGCAAPAGSPPFSCYNPFSNQTVRRSLNYLVDRNFIKNEIYGGYATPYVSPWPSKLPEYRREQAYMAGLDQNYSYNPTKAQADIAAALLAQPGMTRDTAGKFMYKGFPLKIDFVIRTEDIRLDIGNYVAGLLENAGFTVTRDYQPGAAAFAKVYNGPPNTGVWNIYTEGFGITALQAWQDDWIAGLYTHWSGETVWDFYRAPPQLESEATKLLFGQYTSLADRQAKIRLCSKLALDDGVRVQMVAESAVFIYSGRISAAVNDLVAGPWGLFTTRSARYGSPGGTLFVGQPLQWNSQWNPYRGFTWLYDATQYKALTDPGMYNRPDNGLTVAVRANPTVVTTWPTGPNLTIPSDAKVFDAKTKAFVNVPTGATAISKVTYDFTFGKWHDGTPISMDDVWYQIASYPRREGGSIGARAVNPYLDCHCTTGDPTAAGTVYTATPKNATAYSVGDIGKIDARAASPGVNQWLGLFKGARQISPTQMEIYADLGHVDSGTIALTMEGGGSASVNIFPSLPWQIHETMVQTLLENTTRFDKSTALAANKVLVDVIKQATLTPMDNVLARFTTANERPPGLNSTTAPTIPAANATARWAALNAWRASHNHYWDSQGPFYLDTVNVPVKQSIMKRFVDSPFPADKWDQFLAQNVPSVTVGSIPDVVPGLAADIAVQTTVSGVPTSNLAVKYLLRNAGLNTIVTAGVPKATGTGTWNIGLDQNTTGRLVPGAHEMIVTVAVGELGVPVGVTKSFIVIPQAVYLEKLINEQKAKLAGVTTDLGTVQGQLGTANSQIASLNTLLIIAIGVAVAGVLVGVVSTVLSMRRSGGSGKKPPESTEEEKTGEEL